MSAVLKCHKEWTCIRLSLQHFISCLEGKVWRPNVDRLSTKLGSKLLNELTSVTAFSLRPNSIKWGFSNIFCLAIPLWEKIMPYSSIECYFDNAFYMVIINIFHHYLCKMWVYCSRGLMFADIYSSVTSHRENKQSAIAWLNEIYYNFSNSTSTTIVKSLANHATSDVLVSITPEHLKRHGWP